MIGQLVLINAKICQVLLRYTSFVTRGQNVIKKTDHEPCGGQIVESLKIAFLAHLSRRLMGELIVYRSLWRPSFVRPSAHNYKQLLL